MPTFRITNLKEFRRKIDAGSKKLAKSLMKTLEDDVLSFSKQLAKQVEDTPEYRELLTDDNVRGVLGMATPERKFGSDTDGPDLLKLLRQFKVRRLSLSTAKISIFK